VASIPGAAGPGAGYPQWFVDVSGGSGKSPDKVTNAATKAFAITVTFPGKLVFFTSEAAAQAYANSQGGSVAVLPSGVTDAGQAALNDAGSAATGLASVPEFLTRLEEPQTWLRVAEVLLGGILLIVAVKGFTDPVTRPVTQGVKSGAKTAVKVGGWFA
jgi:hypothetical protein